eukprot:EG_transcript_4884
MLSLAIANRDGSGSLGLCGGDEDVHWKIQQVSFAVQQLFSGREPHASCRRRCHHLVQMGHAQLLLDRLRDVLADVAAKVMRHNLFGLKTETLRARTVTAPDLNARSITGSFEATVPFVLACRSPSAAASNCFGTSSFVGSQGSRQRAQSFQFGTRVQVLDMAKLKKFWLQCKVQVALLKEMLHPLDPHEVQAMGLRAFAQQAFDPEVLQQLSGCDHLPARVIQEQKKVLDQLIDDCRHHCGQRAVSGLLQLSEILRVAIETSPSSPANGTYDHPDDWEYEYDEEDYDLDDGEDDGFMELNQPEDFMFAPLLLVDDAGQLQVLQGHEDEDEGEAPPSRYYEEFEELSVIGTGGGGIVCLARHRGDQRLYAIKKVLLDGNESRNRKLRLEAKIMETLTSDVPEARQLGTRHVVTYFDSWDDPFDSRTADQFPGELLPHSSSSSSKLCDTDSPSEEGGPPCRVLCIQMEYCERGNLRKFLSCLPDALDVPTLLGHFIQIVDGLNYVHDHKFVHLDIKPENIFLASEMDADGVQEVMKVGDFGLSCSIGAVSGAGTVPYAAPEVLQNSAVDQKADVYSLGVVLLECFGRWTTLAERSRVLDRLQKAPQLDNIPQELLASFPALMELVVSMMQRPSWKRPPLRSVRQRLRELLRQPGGRKRAFSPPVSVPFPHRPDT